MNLPFVSVIMPIRDEADYIEQSLGSVLQQDYPATHIEVIVVDGMSVDNTRDIITHLVAQYPHISVLILDNPKHIVPTGMNIALTQAQGEIIIRVDGHCKIASDYLSQCVKHLQQENLAGVGGPIETISETPIGETIALAMCSPFGVGGSAFRTIRNRELFVDTIAFPAYTRQAIEHVGPYDEELIRNQDDEYNYRLRALGYKLLLSPDIQSQYYSRASLRKLWRQYFQYGYYKVRVMQKHPHQMRPRQFVPPVFVATVALGSIFALFSVAVFGIWIFILGMYILINLATSIQISGKAGWNHLKLLPIVFVTLHISYGIGFLKGLIAFRNRWGDYG